MAVPSKTIGNTAVAKVQFKGLAHPAHSASFIDGMDWTIAHAGWVSPTETGSSYHQ